ncbi:hypothetical protein ORF083R [Spotted knifejaw iridovirus]|nr:hypothetical protein ORF083R [Spotted knifejaw iridovirus]
MSMLSGYLVAATFTHSSKGLKPGAHLKKSLHCTYGTCWSSCATSNRRGARLSCRRLPSLTVSCSWSTSVAWYGKVTSSATGACLSNCTPSIRLRRAVMFGPSARTASIFCTMPSGIIMRKYMSGVDARNACVTT